MAEPITSSSSVGLVVASGIGLAGLLPGVNGDFLLGALLGATVFVLWERGETLWRRLVYFPLSVGAGYIGAPEVLLRLPIASDGVAALLVSVLAVAVAHKVLDVLAKFDLLSALDSLLGAVVDRFRGNRE